MTVDAPRLDCIDACSRCARSNRERERRTWWRVGDHRVGTMVLSGLEAGAFAAEAIRFRVSDAVSLSRVGVCERPSPRIGAKARRLVVGRLSPTRATNRLLVLLLVLIIVGANRVRNNRLSSLDVSFAAAVAHPPPPPASQAPCSCAVTCAICTSAASDNDTEFTHLRLALVFRIGFPPPALASRLRLCWLLGLVADCP